MAQLLRNHQGGRIPGEAGLLEGLHPFLCVGISEAVPAEANWPGKRGWPIAQRGDIWSSFKEYFPSKQEGRTRLYSEEGVDILKEIARLFSQGLNVDQVRAKLQGEHVRQ